MDKFPLLLEGKASGELTTEREALYTWFTARCRHPEEGVWCAWAVGDQGELRIGVLEPTGNQAVIRRRFSDRMTASLGMVLRGEIRPAVTTAAAWKVISEPNCLFRTSWINKQLRGVQGVMLRKEDKKCFLAFPYDKEKEFPLTALFCFARIKCIHGQQYVVYAFDEKEWPIFQ